MSNRVYTDERHFILQRLMLNGDNKRSLETLSAHECHFHSRIYYEAYRFLISFIKLIV